MFGWDRQTTLLHADYAMHDAKAQQSAQQAKIATRERENTERVAPIFGGTDQMKEALTRAATWLTEAERSLIEPGLKSENVEVRVVAARQLQAMLAFKSNADNGTRVTATPRAAVATQPTAKERASILEALASGKSVPLDMIRNTL